jgi:hypothetical protein
MKDHHHGCNLSPNPPGRRSHESMNSGNGNKEAPQLDQVHYGRRADCEHGETERQAVPKIQGTEPPSTAEATSAPSPKEVAIKEHSNLHNDRQIMISGAIRTACTQVIDSCRIMDMGFNRISPRPTKGYKPV